MLEGNLYVFHKHKGYHNTPLRQFELEEKCTIFVQMLCSNTSGHTDVILRQMRQNEGNQSTDAQGPSVSGD